MDKQFIKMKRELIGLLLEVNDKPKMNNYLLQLQTIIDGFNK
jgi:hypothetical protein